MNCKNIDTSLFNKNFFLLNILFLPILLVTGSFLSDLSVVLISVLFLKFFYANINFFFKLRFFKFFFIFYFLIILSSVFSDDIIFSLKTSIPYVRFFFLVLIIYSLCIFNHNFFIIFSKIFIIIYFILIFDGFFQFFFGYNIVGLVSPIPNRLSGFFGDELVLGSYISRFFPLFLFCLFFLKIKKVIIYIFILIVTIFLILCGDRVSLLMAILLNIYFIFINKNFRLIGIFFLFIYLFSGFFLIKYNEGIYSRYTQTIGELGINKKFTPGYIIQEGKNSIYNDSKKLFKKYNFFSPMHENYLITSLNMFKDRPIIGHGPKTYRIKCKLTKYKFDDLSCSTHPHNLYAQLLSEIGIIGAFFIFIFFIYFLFILIRHFICSILNFNNYKYILSDCELCLIFSFIITLLPIVPSGNFFNNWLSIIYFFPIGFYLGLKHIENKKNND